MFLRHSASKTHYAEPGSLFSCQATLNTHHITRSHPRQHRQGSLHCHTRKRSNTQTRKVSQHSNTSTPKHPNAQLEDLTANLSLLARSLAQMQLVQSIQA
eukprot:1197573-Rhodomonas_salina.2